jgi:polyhydroxybutyrate depolymerase
MKSEKFVRFGIIALLGTGCTSSGPGQQLPESPLGGASGTATQSTEGSAGQGAPTMAEAGRVVTGSVAGSAGGAGGANGTTARLDAGVVRDAAAPRDASKDATAPQKDATNATDAKPPTQVCPSSSTLKAGDNRATIEHGGLSRSYVVYVPSSVKSGKAVPLVLDFHGNGSNSAQEESGSGWQQKADTEGFIMIYPDGVGNSWNVGNCCGQALSGNVDDVGFAKTIVSAVSEAACIDPKRVYATGISNGAGLSHRLACEAADVFAAIAAASADLVTDPCKPVRPISELSVRGLNDVLVAYAGGNTGSTGWYSPGAKGTLDLWKGIDQCTGSVETTRQYCETYSSCAAGVEVTLCSLPNTGHILYTNTVGFSVPEVAWDMFKRQPMP